MISKILSDTAKIFLCGSHYKTYKFLKKIWKEFHIQFLSTLDILQITRNFVGITTPSMKYAPIIKESHSRIFVKFFTTTIFAQNLYFYQLKK